MDEFELIGRIRERLTREDARIELGIGDDAAVLRPMAHGSVWTVDVVVEGVHFDRRWLAWEDVGWRGYVAALSDLAAMGAAPVAGLLSLVIPNTVTEAEVLALIDGVAAASDAYGAPVIGGNVSAGAQLALHSSVVGERPAVLMTRGGARVGDAVFVTGTVGAAALGWTSLSKGRDEAPFADRWRRPRARFDVMDQVAKVATACIDVSDGVLGDLGHVCEASGVGADVEIARLPLELGHRALAAAIGADPDALALAGGEDFELLFTAPRDEVPPALATHIGVVTPGDRPRAIDATGSIHAISSTGHRHRIGGRRR